MAQRGIYGFREFNRREHQMFLLQVGHLGHALSDQITGIDEILTDECLAATGRLALRFVEIECNDRNNGVFGGADIRFECLSSHPLFSLHLHLQGFKQIKSTGPH